MAADYRRKRLNGASMVAYGSPEQHRTKRKNTGLVWNELAMKSHISVEWDGNKQRVVAKREQIGISRRQMRPFVNVVPNGHKILADVLAIPPELFDLDNLSEVLSYEVWNTHLSENEKNFLMQFLPTGLEPHQVVQDLLSGDNFNFGNPFVKWGASLCSGDLHPDLVVNQEHHLKSDKRAYYSQLNNYHNDMVGSLIRLKSKWENGRIGSERSKNVTGTSESFPLGVEEKAYGDNRISIMGQGDKLHRRALDNGFGKDNHRNLIASSDDTLNVGARPKKGENVHEQNINSSDGDKHMSCIKISKKQHELVKSMKLSGKRIQSRSIKHVLGDIDNFRVQPYEVFIKEEQKKLHGHWLQLASKDLPAAYANWTDRQIQTHAIRNSLVAEMNDKSKLLVEDEDIVSSEIQLVKDQEEDRGPKDQSSLEDGEDSIARSQFSLEDDEGSIARSPENEALRNSYHSCNDELNNFSMDSEKNCVLSREDYASQNKIEYSRNTNNTQDVPVVGDGVPFSSDGHVWQPVEMPHSYYDPPASNEYAANGLSLVNPRVNGEQQITLISSLNSGLHQEDTTNELLHSQSDNVPFSSYQSQEQIDLLQSLLKGGGVNSYNHEQKRAGLNFQASNNVVMGGGQFSSHFTAPLQTSPTLLDQGQRRGGEVYMPENMAINNYSDGGRYLIPRQDPLSAANSITDWAVNAPPMVAPSQSHLNVNTGNFVGQHWFPADHQIRGGWNGSGGASLLPSQNIGPGGNLDQGLYSILNQCNQLRPGSHSNPYNSVRHIDQFLPRRTYGGALDAGKPMINAVVPPPLSHPLDYFSGRPSALVPDDTAWMNLPHQNSVLHDQGGKPS